jgi:phage protein D
MGDLTLDESTFTFDELEKKYAKFYSPTVEIIVEGTKIIRETPAAITKITVESSIDSKADTFSFIVINAYDLIKREFLWVDEYFSLGKEIEIQMGYLDKLETVFSGIITSISFSCEDDTSPNIIVKGMDKSFLMMTSNKSTSWDKKKFSDIATEIGGKYGLKTVVDATTNQIIKVAKTEDQSDFQFLADLAKRSNYDFFVFGKSMYFRKPLTSMTPVVNLMWGISLISFSADVNLASQVGSYTVRSFKTNKTEVIESKAASTDIKKLGSNTKTGADLLKAIGSYFDRYESNKVLDTADEGKDLAKSKLNNVSMDLITGSGQSLGIPEIKAGRYIKLDGLGKKLSQPYYISSVTHTMDENGYTTLFQVRGNAI